MSNYYEDELHFELVGKGISETWQLVPTWLPGLSDDSREDFLDRTYRRTKTYLDTIRTNGPPGWKSHDPDAHTVWTCRLPHNIQNEVPMNDDDLCGELPYRYSTYKPTKAKDFAVSVEHQNLQAVSTACPMFSVPFGLKVGDAGWLPYTH